GVGGGVFASVFGDGHLPAGGQRVDWPAPAGVEQGAFAEVSGAFVVGFDAGGEFVAALFVVGVGGLDEGAHHAGEGVGAFLAQRVVGLQFVKDLHLLPAGLA